MLSLTTASGQRVLALPQQHLHRSVITYAVRVGPRFEKRETAGVSHFLEHMLHRGTERWPSAHEQAVAVESLGCTLDASTGVDHGTLTLTCPPESLEAAAELLGEITRSPRFSDIDVERGIVHEELLEDRDERGWLVDPDALVRERLFGDHPLGFPIGGTPATLATFDEALLRKHHGRHYNTTSSVVAIAGRLPPRARLTRMVERAFAGHPVGRPLKTARFRLRSQGPGLHIVRSPTSQVSLRLGALGPGHEHADEAATELLLRVVDDGTSTRLYETLCDRLGLCYEVSAAWEAYDEIGLFDVAAEAQDEAMPRVLTEILTMLRQLAADGPTPEEVQKAKRRARWQAGRAADQPEVNADDLALSALRGEPCTTADRLGRLDAVTPADVRRAARRLFRPEAFAVALVGPVSRATERRARTLLSLS